MVALIFVFLLLPVVSLAEMYGPTNTYNLQAILDYDIDSTTLTAADAAGSVLSFYASPQQVEDVTGSTFEDHLNLYRAFIEDNLTNSYNYQEFYWATDAISNYSPSARQIFGRWKADTLTGMRWFDIEDVYNSLPPELRSRFFGSVQPWAHNNTNSPSISVPTYISDVIEVSEFTEDEQLPGVWNLHNPTPNVWFLNISSEFFSGLGPGDFAESLLSALIPSDPDTNDFTTSISSLINLFVEYLMDNIESLHCRNIIGRCCLFAYWAFVLVWIARNGSAVVDEIASVFRRG